MEHQIVFSFFLIFSGALLLATLALYTRQPLIIAYIVLGALVGPHAFGWIENADMLSGMSTIGIIFLLFLLGLDMQPMALWHVLRNATLAGLLSSLAFFALGYALALLFAFSQLDALVIGLAMMFSSTIIGLKLLPTTVLHHKRTGELMVGLLLIQDMLAISVLIVLGVLASQQSEQATQLIWLPFVSLPLLAVASFVCVKYILLALMQKFDRFQEYIFILAIGWCLGLSEAAYQLGLSHEIGAFIAGVSLATSPVAQFIALSLKPLRDFFLVLFFFALGAGLNLSLLQTAIVPALILAAGVLVLKPIVFRLLLSNLSEKPSLAWDIGFRLGQISEFSLLIAVFALENTLLSQRGALLIQATAIITFAISSYIVIFNYPNPIAVSEKLRRD